MKRPIGISRNRFETFQNVKSTLTRKKNIFKFIGKQAQVFDEGLSNDAQSTHNSNNNLLSATTKHSVHSSEAIDTNLSCQIYEQAKSHLQQVAEYRKKMTSEIKLRMISAKDSEIKIYEENISKYSSKAVENLLKSEKLLHSIRKLKASTETEQKFYKNMEKSLALEIRQVSKSLRTQQKQYFDRLRAYETGTANRAIQLNQQDRQKMKAEFQEMEICDTQMGEDDARNKQITDLVKSINQLSNVYKQLNELVIEQGSLIDRIDFNIEQTLTHVVKGVEHLKGADEKASSPCAKKCMCILIILILVMACVIGFKVAK